MSRSACLSSGCELIAWNMMRRGRWGMAREKEREKGGGEREVGGDGGWRGTGKESEKEAKRK